MTVLCARRIWLRPLNDVAWMNVTSEIRALSDWYRLAALLVCAASLVMNNISDWRVGRLQVAMQR